jgi:hypothetical protein
MAGNLTGATTIVVAAGRGSAAKSVAIAVAMKPG